MQIVYKTTNLINGKSYVGKDSKNRHEYLGSGIVLNKSIKKYGKENFIKETVAWCDTKEHLNFLEKFYIKFFNTRVPRGYNLTDGGDGGPIRKGMHNSKEHGRKVSKTLTGRKPSVRTREIWSAQRKGKRIGVNNPFYGKKHSLESCQLISRQTQEAMQKPEVLEKLKRGPDKKPRKKVLSRKPVKRKVPNNPNCFYCYADKMKVISYGKRWFCNVCKKTWLKA